MAKTTINKKKVKPKAKAGKEKKIDHNDRNQPESDAKQFERDLNLVLRAAHRCVDYCLSSDLMTYGDLTEETKQLVGAYERFRIRVTGQ